MPQFDFVSNYFLLIVFFLFFILFLVLMSVCLNSLYKYIHILKINEDQLKAARASLELLKAQEKKKKLWYAYHKK